MGVKVRMVKGGGEGRKGWGKKERERGRYRERGRERERHTDREETESLGVIPDNREKRIGKRRTQGGKKRRAESKCVREINETRRNLRKRENAIKQRRKEMKDNLGNRQGRKKYNPIELTDLTLKKASRI